MHAKISSSLIIFKKTSENKIRDTAIMVTCQFPGVRSRTPKRVITRCFIVCESRLGLNHSQSVDNLIPPSGERTVARFYMLTAVLFGTTGMLVTYHIRTL